MIGARTIDVGVIGVGIMGSGHARILHRSVTGARVAAVADPDTARAAALAAEVGADVLEPEALIERVDAVIVAAPDRFHAPLTLACIAAGTPVLCEKPLATTPEDARTVVEAERASGRSLVCVGLMRRFDPAHVTVKATIGPDGIGEAVLFRGIHRNQWRPVAPTAHSTVVASGVHDIDSARWLLGELISVSAVAYDSRHDGAVDLVHIQGVHAGGAISVLEVNCAAHYGYEVSAEVVGTAGTASTLDPDRATVRLTNRRGTELPTNWMPRFDDAYRLQLRAWVDHLADGTPYAGAGALDGYRDQVVAACVLEAIETGRVVPVRVPD